MALLPATMAEALWIGAAGGKNHFSVEIGQGTSGGSNTNEYLQAEIEAGFTDAAKFYLNASGNPVFKINASAGTTSTNTVHPRSEAKEYFADGITRAAWDGRTGKHTMKGRSRIIEFTDNRPWICFFQCHGSPGSPNTSDLFRVQTEGTNGTTTNLSIVCRRTPPTGGSEIRTVLRTGYNLNDWVSWETWIGGDGSTADDGRLRIWLDGVLCLDVTGMGQVLSYWKTGCYLQDSVGEGAGSATNGAVEMEKGSLQVWHTGYPAPTTPIFTGADDGLGGGSDTTPPTIPDNLAGIRGDQTALLVWDASIDAVGVDHYVVRRSSVEDAGTVTTTANLGKTDDGASTSSSSANKTVVSVFVAGTTGNVTTGHARLWVDSGTASIKMCVYDLLGSGEPGNLLGLSDALTVSGTTEADRTFTFTGGQQCAITAGTSYWIGFTWADPGTNNISWSRGSTSGVSRQNALNASSTFGTPGSALSGPIDAYVVVSTTTATDGSVDIAHPTTTTYTDTGRTNGVEYTYTVSAVDAASNESAQSDSVTVTPGPPDTTPPTTPTSLVATGGDRRVVLTWTASTDADTGVRNYNVYRNGTLVGQPDDVTFTDLDLVNGTAYSYTVSAVDNSLNEGSTASVSGTPVAPTIGGVPFLPRELGSGAALAVEVAFGADLADNPDTWTWTDVTRDVRHDPGIATSLGRNDESSTSNPADLTLVLTNTTGDYSLGGRSQHWPYVRRNTPVRVRIDPDDATGGRVVFWGGAVGWTPGWDSLTGRIPTVTLTAAGTLRRLTQGAAPIQSAFRRGMAALTSVVAYWPMEEGQQATYAPPVRGGGLMKVEGSPGWGTSSGLYCSDALPALKSARLTAFPAPYADTGKVQVRFLLQPPENGDTAGGYLLSVFTTGTIARWDVVYAPGTLTVNRYNDSGSLNSTDLITFGIDGVPGRLSLELVQSGGNIAWTIQHKDARNFAAAGAFSGTITGKTVGVVSWVQFNANQQLKDTIVGHLTIENATSSIFTNTDVLRAFDGEYISSGNTNPIVSRLERLCSENQVPLTRHPSVGLPNSNLSSTFDTVGPQLVGKLVDLLREAEAADQGQLWDGRAHGLSYTTRRRREQGIVGLTIDAAAGELAEGFAPVDDDQRTRNKVEVKRTYGITDTYTDETGPLGTDTIGIYDESVTLNLGLDTAVAHHAQWQVSLGTVQGLRYPSVTVDLRASPHLAPDVLDIIPGARIDVTNLDDTLAAFTASTVSLIVEGIAHDITATSWRATFRCSPFEPWAVGTIAAETGDTSDMVMRLDTDGSTLAATVPPGATSLSVATTGTYALWTTNSDDYPLTLSVGGLPVVATACSGSSSPQTFTVEALPVARLSGAEVALWEPRRLGMGVSA